MDQPVHVFELPVRRLQSAFPRCRLFAGNMHHRQGVLDCAQRIAQLMRESREESVLVAVRCTQIRFDRFLFRRKHRWHRRWKR